MSLYPLVPLVTGTLLRRRSRASGYNAKYADLLYRYCIISVCCVSENTCLNGISLTSELKRFSLYLSLSERKMSTLSRYSLFGTFQNITNILHKLGRMYSLWHVFNRDVEPDQMNGLERMPFDEKNRNFIERDYKP